MRGHSHGDMIANRTWCEKIGNGVYKGLIELESGMMRPLCKYTNGWCYLIGGRSLKFSGADGSLMVCFSFYIHAVWCGLNWRLRLLS